MYWLVQCVQVRRPCLVLLCAQGLLLTFVAARASAAHHQMLRRHFQIDLKAPHSKCRFGSCAAKCEKVLLSMVEGMRARKLGSFAPKASPKEGPSPSAAAASAAATSSATMASSPSWRRRRRQVRHHASQVEDIQTQPGVELFQHRVVSHPVDRVSSVNRRWRGCEQR